VVYEVPLKKLDLARITFDLSHFLEIQVRHEFMFSMHIRQNQHRHKPFFRLERCPLASRKCSCKHLKASKTIANSSICIHRQASSLQNPTVVYYVTRRWKQSCHTTDYQASTAAHNTQQLHCNLRTLESNYVFSARTWQHLLLVMRMRS
jgi:hypothetical protein